jgi:hypothetical protein
MGRELGEEQAPVPRLYHRGRGAGKAVRGALPVLRLTNQRSSRMSPPEVHAPAVPGSTPPAVTAAGGEEPCRRRRVGLPFPRLARRHPATTVAAAAPTRVG